MNIGPYRERGGYKSYTVKKLSQGLHLAEEKVKTNTSTLRHF